MPERLLLRQLRRHRQLLGRRTPREHVGLDEEARLADRLCFSLPLRPAPEQGAHSSGEGRRFASGGPIAFRRSAHGQRRRERPAQNLGKDGKESQTHDRGWYRLLASANFGELVLGCINADFCNPILIFQY